MKLFKLLKRMNRKTLKRIKIGLEPFITKLEQEGKPLSTSCISPILDNDNTTPFVLEVQAEWIDQMECLDAISYLFDVLRNVGTSQNIMNSIFAIQVIGMDSDIKCSQTNMLVQENQACLVCSLSS